jgi:hypothetical protein
VSARLPAAGDVMRWGVMTARAPKREKLPGGQGEVIGESLTSSGNSEAAWWRRTVMFDDGGRRAMAGGDGGMVLQHRGAERGARPKEKSIRNDLRAALTEEGGSSSVFWSRSGEGGSPPVTSGG